MKGKIVTSLFGLPFAGFGLFMLWSIGSILYDGIRMQGWQPVPATIEAGGYHVGSGDSDTYRAWADYRYDYNGQSYRGNRVAISDMGDNIGDFQRQLGNRLSAAAASGQAVTAWVNPSEPGEAVIDRSIRWGFIGFQSIFVFVFGGIGFGLLVFAWKKSADGPVEDDALNHAPWLANNKWQTSSIRSGSKTAMWFAWGFSGIWCLVSAPLPFVVWEEITSTGNKLALVGLLFPLIGAGLVTWAIRLTREWRRFGPAPVTLDPFPGAIGGHVGGTIDLRLPFDPAQEFEVTLMAIRSYITGSGKNRSRREKADWQDSRLAHAEPGGNGTRLVFRFDVPDGLPAADATRKKDSYRLWRLNVQARLPGADLHRDYDLPVYPTGQRSQSISTHSLEIANRKQDSRDEQKLRERFRFEQLTAGKRCYFPIGRNAPSSFGAAITGGIFATIGVFVLQDGGPAILGGAFTLIGGLIAVLGIYMLGNSLEVRQEGGEIVSLRRLFGLPVATKRVQRQAIVRLEKDSNLRTQSGGKHILHYHVSAVASDGHSIRLGEGFQGASEAKAAMRFFAREFSLPLPQEDDASAAAENLLAAD